MKQKRVFVSLALIMCLLTWGCDVVGSAVKTTDAVTTFVGKAANSNAFVAITIKGTDVWGYICDGTTLGQWFDGAMSSGSAISIGAENGAQMVANVAGNAAQGTIKVADQTFNFTGDVATGVAGFFRGVKIVDGRKAQAGVIVLADGDFRGLVTGIPNPTPITGPLPSSLGASFQLDNIGSLGSFTMTPAIPGSDDGDPTVPPTASYGGMAGLLPRRILDRPHWG